SHDSGATKPVESGAELSFDRPQRERPMNVVEKTQKPAVDFDRFRLRGFLAGLGADELETHAAPIALADLGSVLENNPRAVLFRPAGPDAQELAGNVTASRGRLAAAFGVAPADLLHEIQRRLRNKPDIVEVSRTQAPAQAVVLTGADADLTALPVHLQHG